MSNSGMIAAGLFSLVVWAGIVWAGCILISHAWRSLGVWLRDRRKAKEAD